MTDIMGNNHCWLL